MNRPDSHRVIRAIYPTDASPDLRGRSGFTLLELMVSVTILFFVVAGVFESMTRQHRSSMVTENVVEVQNNARAIGSLIERDIRMAGYMVPDAASVCGFDTKTGSDELYLSETEQISAPDLPAGDVGARLVGNWASNPAIGSTTTYNLTSATTDLDGDGTYFYDNDADGNAESDFRLNGGVIVADLANPRRGSLCGVVTASSSTQISVRAVAGGLDAHGASDAEEEIVFVPAARYAIRTRADGVTQLERNGDLIAEGVEDFQVSYFYDLDRDGTIDTANVDVDGNGAADAGATEEPGAKTGWTFNPRNWNNSRLREVRFSIVVRTRDTDANFKAGDFAVYENRTKPVGPMDGFRRRVVAGSVRPRNVNHPGGV